MPRVQTAISRAGWHTHHAGCRSHAAVALGHADASVDMAPLNAIVHSAESRPLPAGVQSWLGGAGLTVLRVDDADDVVETTLRGRPRLILMDGRGSCESAALTLLKRIKGDVYTAVIPTVMMTDADPRCVERSFAAGADEVLSPSFPDAEASIRLDVVLRRWIATSWCIRPRACREPPKS